VVEVHKILLALPLLWPQGAWHAYLVAAGLAPGNTIFNMGVQAGIPAITTDEQRLAANPVAWSPGRFEQTTMTVPDVDERKTKHVTINEHDFRARRAGLPCQLPPDPLPADAISRLQ
jgi:hypothetical protein